MKGKNKVILGSALAIAMSASMIAGSTFALFTSESSVNIAVTSGKVNVTASLGDLQTKSLTDVDYTETTQAYGLEFGGVANIDGSSLTIANFVAGDGAKFNIAIDDDSTIGVKYRLTMSTNIGKGVSKAQALSLARMNITMDGKTVVGNSVVTEWQALEGNKNIPVTVEIDQKANEEAQDKTITLFFTVQAIQGNGVENIVISSEQDLVNFAKDVNAGNDYEGKIVTLASDLDMAGVEMSPIGTHNNYFRGIFDGKGHKIENLQIDEKTDGVGLFGYIHGNAVLRDFTLKNANVKGVNYVGGVVGKAMLTSPAVTDFASTQSFIQNVNVVDCNVEGGHWVGGVAGHSFGIIRDCTVTGGTVKATPYFILANKMDNGDKVGGLVGMQQDASLIGNKVSGTQVEGVRDLGVIAGHISMTNHNVFVTEFSDNVGENVTITRGVYGELPIATDSRNLGELCGRKPTGQCEDGGVAVQNSIFKEMWFKDIFDNYRTHNNKFTGTAYGETNCSTPDNGFVYIAAVDELIEFAKDVNKGTSYEGKTITLLADLDLGGKQWTPIGTKDKYFKGTFDGNGHTISNLTVGSAETKPEDRLEYAGLFGKIHGTVQNLTVDHATVYSKHYASAIAGYMVNKSGSKFCQLLNCKVTNSTIVSNPEQLADGKWDNGDKVGLLAGYFGQYAKAENCTAENSTVIGFRGVGGLFGNCQSVDVKNCHVNNVTITLQVHDGEFKDATNGTLPVQKYGSIFGSVSDAADKYGIENWKETDNTATDCTFVYLSQDGDNELENRAMTDSERYQAIYE